MLVGIWKLFAHTTAKVENLSSLSKIHKNTWMPMITLNTQTKTALAAN